MRSEALVIEPASDSDVAALFELHRAAAEELTAIHGRGPWTRSSGERSILRSLSESYVFVGRQEGGIRGTFRLTRRKPWAIDPAYFTPVPRPLYLLDLAVHPTFQRQGIGSALLTFAARFAGREGFNSIRLDAYDAPAGAEEFYRKCGMAFRGRRTYRATPLVYFESLVSGEASAIRN